MKRRKVDPASRDPWPYDGPIMSADGKRPYNHYLWPTEGDDFWARDDLGYRFSSRWKFSVIRLADGRVCVDGMIWSIEKDQGLYGGRNNFPTRTAALRCAAARCIRAARRARNWTGPDSLHNPADFSAVVNWVRATVARETAAPESEPLHFRAPPEPQKPIGLALFDYGLPHA